jgi:uncharacterized protein (TIGR03067 family)
MNLLLILTLAVGPAPAADAPRAGLAKKDLAGLQGSWSVLSITEDREDGKGVGVGVATTGDGDSVPPGFGEVVFSGGQCTFRVKAPGDEFKALPGEAKGTVTVNRSSKPPTIELKGKGVTLQGIYSLKGNELTICWKIAAAGAKTAFPKSFSEAGTQTWGLKRRKAQQKSEPGAAPEKPAANDPLRRILDRLDAIERRLDALERNRK